MITPQSEVTVFNKVRLFNINLKENEKAELCNILKPINSILNANDKNSIYVFKDGDTVHAEALINVDGTFRNTQSLGISVQDSLRKIIPITIKNTFHHKKKTNDNCLLVG